MQKNVFNHAQDQFHTFCLQDVNAANFNSIQHLYVNTLLIPMSDTESSSSDEHIFAGLYISNPAEKKWHYKPIYHDFSQFRLLISKSDSIQMSL